MNRVFRMALESLSPGVKLYHYSASRHEVLKTREKSSSHIDKEKLEKAKESMEEHRDPGTYFQHISFFFEPVPLDLVGKIFGKDHHFWFPGHEIYEHIVDVDHLPKFKYRIVESPIAVEMFYATDWGDLDDSDALKYFRELAEKQKAHGEIGSNPSTFKATAHALVGSVRKAYEELPKRPNWEELKNKYAATVPHVMLYPTGGEVKVDEIKQVTVGH